MIDTNSKAISMLRASHSAILLPQTLLLQGLLQGCAQGLLEVLSSLLRLEDLHFRPP